MQQLDELRDRMQDRVGDRARWFRLGLISTTAVAPLIARWNDLRVARRDLRAREDARMPATASRASAVSARARSRADNPHPRRGRGAAVVERLAVLTPDDMLAPTPRRENMRLGLWLAGVALGLVAAGAGAFVLARRRIAATVEEPLLELPATQAPTNGSWPVDRRAQRGGRDGATPASRSGATVTTGRGEPTIAGASGGFGPASLVESGTPEPERPRRSMVDPEEAAIVGNIHTMVYHEASDEEHLPSEENRTYFATEEEARAAGFRPARGGVPFASEASAKGEGRSA